jgi:hypothetical protein
MPTAARLCCVCNSSARRTNELLVLRSTSHLPPWPPDRWLDWAWTYVLDQIDDDHVRVLLRARTALGPPWLAWTYRVMIWMDFVMARSHLRGLKARVGVERAPTAAATVPLAI